MSAGAPEVPSGPGELARALAPLHQAYLRRLEEMAGRVRPEVLLREPVIRDGAGKLVEGTDGFPVRHDVADSDTGSTFEVRSGRWDAPALERVRVGGVEIDLVPGCWEALVVCCSFDGDPVEEDAHALASLLRAFHELAWHGAFSPRRAAEPWSGRPHGVAITVAGPQIAATYDLGTCPPGALEALLHAIDGFGRDRAPIARVTIGGKAPDPNQAL